MNDFFEKVINNAFSAGIQAGENLKPIPMHPIEHENPLDDSSKIKIAYQPVNDGVCGFAWINIKPGNSKFANYLKKNGIARKDSYYGGVTIWISEFGQSLARKEIMAKEIVNVIKNSEITGIKSIYSASKMD